MQAPADTSLAAAVDSTQTVTEAATGAIETLQGWWNGFFAMIPNLYGVLAEAPIAVGAYDALMNFLMASSLTPEERHVVWFTINAYHDCRYCMAAHTLVAKGDKISEEVIETARRQGTYTNPKLEALRQFTLAMTEKRGWTSPEEIEAFFAAGFSKQQLLEIVVVMAHKVISNYTNHMAGTPIDDAFKPFTWTKPEADAA